jgi:hypothetical protein
MPARPNDPNEFADALARIAASLASGGQSALGDRVIEAGDDMQTAGYNAGPPGAEARQRVRGLLEDVGNDPAAATIRDELTYALGWLRRVDHFHRELSAKRHLNRQPSRDIYRR